MGGMAKQGVRRRKENRSSIRDREGWERKGERTKVRRSSIRKFFLIIGRVVQDVGDEYSCFLGGYCFEQFYQR